MTVLLMKELFRFFYVHVREKDTAGRPGMNKNRWVPKDRRFFQLSHHNVTTSLTSLHVIHVNGAGMVQHMW